MQMQEMRLMSRYGRQSIESYGLPALARFVLLSQIIVKGGIPNARAARMDLYFVPVEGRRSLDRGR